MKNISLNAFSSESAFYKRFGLIITIVSCFVFFGCKDLLTVPTVTAGSREEIPAERVIATPMNVSASHGQKKKITIHWTPVNNASYYFIYKADTPHDTYVQIDEAPGTAASKAIDVPAGYSGYFKVAAVNAYGQLSDMSLTAYGTSLATPVITAIEQEGTSATVYWYMENLEKKSYLNSVIFKVTCHNPNGQSEEKILSNTTDTFCTFENLNSGTEYQYDVETYLLSDVNATEKSLKLSAKTAVSLIPQVPQYEVTEGTQETSVTLTITLPPAVLLSKGTLNSSLEEYDVKPIYFKIERYDESTAKFISKVDYLAFDKKHSIQDILHPTSSEKRIPKDDPIFDTYQEGNTITWTDTAVERGVKYKYRVTSYIDNYYKADNTTPIEVHPDPEKCFVKTGWATAKPTLTSTVLSFQTDHIEDHENLTYVSKATFNFNAAWNALGKDSDYVFALLEQHRKLKNDNGGSEDTVGTTKFIQNNNSYYFISLEELNNHEFSFDFAAPVYPDLENDPDTKTDPESNKEFRGYYNYTLYIVPKEIASQYSDLSSDANKTALIAAALTKDADISTKLVTNQSIPTPTLAVADGYVNKTKITFSIENDTDYILNRQALDETGAPTAAPEEITLRTNGTNENGTTVEGNTGTYIDTGLESGTAYQYTIYASTAVLDHIPSKTVNAFTLGTPDITFDPETADYATITVKWNSVLHSLQEEEFRTNPDSLSDIKYTITHNGHDYIFSQKDCILQANDSGLYESPTNETDYHLTCSYGKEFTLTLKKNIANFDYSSSKPKIAASIAGSDIPVSIKVSNDITQEDSANTTSDSVNVHTLGSAYTYVEATTAKSINQIQVTWNTIPGVSLYAVRRICHSTVVGEEEDKENIIYVSADGSVTVKDATATPDRTAAKSNGSKIILVDNQVSAPANSNDKYELTQEKIAWGIPYDYTVIPVKSTDDDPFDEDFDSIQYTDLNEASITKQGYTLGYGINVVASKADYNDKVTVEWTKPNSFSFGVPSLFYKAENSSNWKKAFSLTKEDLSCNIKLPDEIRTKKVEFAVTYETTDNVKWADSYISYLASKKDSDNEQLNEGYEFTLSSFEADKPSIGSEDFTEQIRWGLWNDLTDSRKKQPESYEVYVKNLNCGPKWFKIASITPNGTVTITKENWYDAEITELPSGGLLIKALNNGKDFTTCSRITRGSTTVTNAIAGTHDGILKVQRDYKHYYKLVAKRKDSSGDTIETALGDIDSTSADSVSKLPVYTYRKISDDEFVKAITLIVADSLWKCGVSEGGTKKSTGKTGSFDLTHPGASKKITWGTNDSNYVHIFTGGVPGKEGESFESGWTIKIPNTTSNDCATYNYLAKLPWNTITVSHETGLSCYQGCVSLIAGDGSSFNFWGTNVETEKWNLSIQYSHKTSSIENKDKIIITSLNHSSFNSNYDNSYTVQNNKTKFYEWLPYEFGSSQSNGISAPSYTGTWWEVRN